MAEKFDVSVAEVDDVALKFADYLELNGDVLDDFKELMFYCLMSEIAYNFKHKGMSLPSMFEAVRKSYILRQYQLKE